MSPAFARLFLGFLFCVLTLNLFALVPYYLELRGASELLYGAVAGMIGLGGIASMAVLGGGADRVSRRRALLRYLAAAWIGNAVALVAMSLHPAFYLVASGLQGVMAGVGLPVVFVWASELSPPERRTEAFAWLGIAGLAGDSLGPLLGESLLMTQPDPRTPSDFFVVFVAANLLWPVSLAFFLSVPDRNPPGGAQSHEGLVSLLRSAKLRWAVLSAVTFGGALGVMLSLGKNFVASIGLEFVSILLGGHTVGAVVVRLLLPWVLARFDRVRLIPIGFSGVALSMILLALTEGYGLLATAGLVYGVSHGLLFPSLLTRLIDFGGAEAAGRITTLCMGIFSLGIGLGPAVGGVVLRLGNFPILFLLLAAGALGGLALTRVAERAHRRSVEASG